MRTLVLIAGLMASGSSLPAHADPPAFDCGDILPPAASASAPGARRALSSEDLVRLRDIGPPDPQGYDDPLFALSPDGGQVAFQLRRADPKHNRYCLAMVVMDAAGKGPPRIVDAGGEPLLLSQDFRGIADFVTGHLLVVTPRWSADGKWFAFLKRVAGRTQVWRAFADGSGSRPVTSAPIDVVDFRVGPDGTNIVYATRPDIEQRKQEYQREGLSGWHYDDRFVPDVSKHPLPLSSGLREVRVVDPGSGQDRAASTLETALVAGHRPVKALGEAGATPAGLQIAATDLSGGAKSGGLRARLPGGAWSICSQPACKGARDPWWAARGSRVRFFRRDGWATASTGIYEWDPAGGAVRRVYLTDDLLSSCAPSGDLLLCRIDASLQPGRLVWLDPAKGSRETLFDPNPEFAQLTLGQPERLHLRNRFGVESIADLVLPVGYVKGRRYPMIVVQYETRGFLRGGTANEYPIQAFANRGYSVLSFKRPWLPEAFDAKDGEELGKQNLREFADRKNVHASLEEAVMIAVARGIADPTRIGITGLSDGSSTLEWALIHSKLFSAAATSSCCWDPSAVWQVGPSAARHFAAEGYPGALGLHDPFWRDVSLSDNVDRLLAPLLISVAESEMLEALFTFTALREAHHPVDLFVFPDEYHARWQPAHRLATYRRSLDWFDYWLRGIRSADPSRAAEIKVWDGLRAEAERCGAQPCGQGEAASGSSSAKPESRLRH